MVKEAFFKGFFKSKGQKRTEQYQAERKSHEDQSAALPEKHQRALSDAAFHGERLSRQHFKHTFDSQHDHLLDRVKAGEHPDHVAKDHKAKVEGWVKKYKDQPQDAGFRADHEACFEHHGLFH